MNPSPYLVAARKRYEAIRSELAEIQTRARDTDVDLTPAELRTATDLANEATELYNAIESLTAQEARSASVAAVAHDVYGGAGSGGGSVGVGGPQSAPASSGALVAVPPLVPSADRVAELHRAAMSGGRENLRVSVVPTGDEGVQHRATITTTQTGTPTVGLNGPLLNEPRRISIAARLGVEHVAGVEGAHFPVFGSTDAADIVTEGSTKPEFDQVTSGSAVPQMISLWTEYTRQVVLSVGSFEQRLKRKLAARVAAREDLLLCTRVLATTGIQTYEGAEDEPYGYSLLGAAAQVLASDVAAAPDLAIVNPLDVVKIFGDAVGGFGESPTEQMRLNLHGMTVYPSSAVAAGTSIVGAWQAAATFVVGLSPSYFVDSMSGLKTNKITTLLEEAVNIAVHEPVGFCEVTFGAPAA
jgi:hypothetical protein